MDHVMDFSECLERLVETARSKQLSVWAGAGISWKTPACRPLARELKLYILESICSHPALSGFFKNRLQQDSNIYDMIASYPLEAFIEQIERHLNIVSDIAKVFRGGSPNKYHLFIAKMMKERFVREVLTTNFDLLIERALESNGWHAGVNYRVYSTESRFARLGSARCVPSVFKIHGTADNEKSMRITLSQVASRGLSESRAIALRLRS